MSLLVIGSGGLLGREVVDQWRGAGRPVVTASHGDGADLRLDLTAPPGTWPTWPAEVTHALVCSSLTSVDGCAKDPEGTARFNVTATIELLSRLLDQGVTPIFCSSDLVFRGDRGNYRENDRREPTTTYGGQKLAVERWLEGQDRDWLVLRLSKLYRLSADDPSPVGGSWRALARGERVRAAVDQVVCPTWAGDVAEALARLLGQGARGVWHVATPVRDTRHSLALRLAGWLGCEHLVEPCRIAEFPFVEPRPLDNSLCSDRLRAATGLVCRDLDRDLLTAAHGAAAAYCLE